MQDEEIRALRRRWPRQMPLWGWAAIVTTVIIAGVRLWTTGRIFP